VDSYAEWYGKPHAAVELQSEAVYGLVELNREKIKTVRVNMCVCVCVSL
jgi:N-acetyl-gamma-glutamyl-phosphate reductase